MGSSHQHSQHQNEKSLQDFLALKVIIEHPNRDADRFVDGEEDVVALNIRRLLPC